MTNTRIQGVRTVLFDVGNTLLFVDLERVAAVLAAAGHPVPVPALAPAEERARIAMYRRAASDPTLTDAHRWAHYVDDVLEGSRAVASAGPDGDAVRARLREALGAAHRIDNLWRALRPGTGELLDGLRARGYTLGVVSNADGRVPDLLRDAGLADRFATIVDSTLVGVEKPDPRIFEIALARLGETARRAVYVGDFPAVDIVGARRAGVAPVLLDPTGELDADGAPVIAGLPELASLLPERAV